MPLSRVTPSPRLPKRMEIQEAFQFFQEKDFKSTARDILGQLMSNGHSLSSLSESSGVGYSVLQRHVVQKLPMSPANARKLSEWSHGVIDPAQMLQSEDLA